ncbi:hypothetical protein L7F22_009340 [Adiantum nelumboides]|nr:hypothetical protein [Adiantum nelumboides]
MTSTLSHFWQLASSSKDDRIASAHALVKGLAPENSGDSGSISKGKQPLFEDGLGKREDDVPENVTDAQLSQAESALESTGNPDLVYAIKRLIKGLASHRESARLGFSVALCELFSRTRSISTQYAIDLILAYSKPNQKVRGQEERDMLFARLFGLHALVRSEVLCDSNITNEDDFRRLIRILHNISSGKHWLRESGTSVIVQAIEQLSKSSNPPKWQSNALKWLVEIVCKDDRVTADSVAIFMTLKQNSQSSFTSAQRLPRFANQDILSSANLPILARILRDAGVEDGNEEEVKIASSASGSTQAHFVWDMIFNQYADATVADGQKAPFAVTYRTLVDENLFAVNSSHQKKAWGFQLIQRAARIVDQSYITDIFMPNLMRTLLNQLSAKDPILQKAAQRACIGLQQAVKERPSIAYDVVLQLTGPNGHYRFDSVTNTKTVETILRSATRDDVRKFADRLISLACQEQSNGRRASILDSLLILVRNTQIETDDACIENILTFFAAHGLFTMKKALEKVSSNKTSLLIVPVSDGFSSSVQSSCRSRFLSCLGDLHAASSSVQQDKTNVDWISRGSEIVAALDKDSQHFTRLAKTQHDILGKVEKTLKSLRSASEKAQGSSKERLHSYSTLLLASSLYVQAALQQEEEVKELIEPMIECANQLLTDKNKPTKKNDEDTPGPMELLIDCLSNALQQPTAFLRSIATQAFDSFVDEMTQSSMRLLIEQLGFNQRNNSEEGEEEEEDQVGEEDDVMSDSVSDTSATSTSSEIDDEDVDAEFAKKIKEALQSGGIADNEEESDGDDAEDDNDDDDESDSSSVSMEDFDDEQMILMDDKLADIFRQKYATRKQEDEARKEEATFHVRIIDLLDHFALRQADNALCVEMVLPLFTIAFEKDKALGQLRQKATTVLRKTLLKGGSNSGSKLNVVGTSSMQSALDSLDAVHKMAATNLTSEQMSLANACNLYLTKSCSPSDQNVPDQLRSIYVATLNDFLERKNNNLKPSFLIDAFSRFPHLAFSLRDELLQAASGEQNSSQNAFRQVQVMEMLRVCIANLVGQLQQQQNLSESITVHGIEKLLKDLAELTFRRVKQDQHRIKEILKSALPYVRLTRKIVEQVKQKTGKEAELEIQQIWPSSEIQSSIEALNTTNVMPNSASLQGLLKQMMALTTVDQKKEGKRKNVEEEVVTKNNSNSTTGKKKAKKVD